MSLIEIEIILMKGDIKDKYHNLDLKRFENEKYKNLTLSIILNKKRIRKIK